MQDHEVIAGQGRAAAGERRGGRVERGDPHHTVRGHDVVAGGVVRDRPARAHVVVQQFQSRRGQVRREPGDADVDVVDVVEIGLFGPAVLGASSGAEPEDGPEESRAAGRVADRDGGVIDAKKGAGAVDGAPLSRDVSLRECEQFQRVAVVITELERHHAPGVIRQPYRAVAADGPEAPVRHDPLICVPHVGHDDRHVLEPQVGARAAGRIRAPRRVRELQELDPLAAQPQQRAPPARLPDAQHADQRRIDVSHVVRRCTRRS